MDRTESRLMDWSDIKFFATIMAGVIVAALLSTARSWKESVTTMATGAFFATIGTGPAVALAGWQEMGAHYLVAGFLAIFGERLARRGFLLIDKLEIPRLWK